jgi:hypothetical protein
LGSGREAKIVIMATDVGVLLGDGPLPVEYGDKVFTGFEVTNDTGEAMSGAVYFLSESDGLAEMESVGGSEVEGFVGEGSGFVGAGGGWLREGSRGGSEIGNGEKSRGGGGEIEDGGEGEEIVAEAEVSDFGDGGVASPVCPRKVVG